MVLACSTRTPRTSIPLPSYKESPDEIFVEFLGNAGPNPLRLLRRKRTFATPGDFVGAGGLMGLFAALAVLAS